MRRIKYAVQLFFVLLSIFVGYQFYRFVLYFESPGSSFVQRPPSVDAFLPIAGLMSFKYFLFMGMVEPVHPASFIIFVSILAVSLLLKKGFCGWICPVGTLSQYVWMVGEKIFGRNFRMEGYLDVSLRSLKYILMALFIIAIGVAMSPNMMVLFFITDYYKAVDVRMLKFFTEMSTTTFWVLSVLVILSLPYKNFFCRYLCPYGALLGLLSFFSPLKIKRREENCIHCRLCSTHCPTLLDVEKKDVVKSPECMGCLTCVSRCPSAGALDITVPSGTGRRAVKPYLFPVLLIVLFYAVIGLGMVTNNWHSKLPLEEYQRIVTGMSKH